MKDLNSIYRPKEWKDVGGQERTVDILRKQVESESGLSNSYILSGKSGVGKTTLARLFFSKLNRGIGNPIQDLWEINASDTRGIDDMRELIREIKFFPLGNYRGVLLDECQMLSKSAWNCLLKPIEEEIRTIWLFCTTELHKVPKTIQTRCQIFKLQPLRWTDIFNRLKYIVDIEKMSITDDGLWVIARNSDNNLRQAIHILEQYSVVGDVEKIIVEDISFDLLNGLSERAPAKIWKAFTSWKKNYPDIDSFLNAIKLDLSTILKIKMGLPVGVSEYRIRAYKKLEKQLNKEDILKMLNLILNTQEKISGIWDYNSLFLNILCKYMEKTEEK